MKRGFEENVPKVRPRVRLGHAFSELESAEEPSPLPASLAEKQPSRHPENLARAEELDAELLHTGGRLHPAEHAREAAQPAPAEMVGTATKFASPDFAAAAIPSLAANPRPGQPARSSAEQARAAVDARLADEDAQVRASIARASDESARGDRLRGVRARAEEAAAPMARESAAAEQEPAESRGPASRKTATAQKVAQLARELSAELELAAEANGRLKTDLDGALAALRRAAEEARERTDERDRLSSEVEKRASAARELLGELEMLEAERDGALAQSGRLSRELRETKTRSSEAVELAQQARAEMEEARNQLQRLAGELEARVAERDAARAELSRTRAEKDSLAEALLAARAEADEALESRTALEEIERALGAARSRVAGIR